MTTGHYQPAPRTIGAARTETWRHPSGRHVTLIGLTHAGAAAEYAAVRAFVVDRETAGAQVQYEGIKPPPPDFAMSDEERALVARLRAAMTGDNDMAHILGLDSQADHLRPEPHWRNTDLNAAELLRVMQAPGQWVHTLEQTAAVLRNASPAVLKVMRWCVRHPGLMALVSRLRLKGDEHAAILRARDAVAGAAAASAGGDVVALWGLGHLPGIGRHLAGAGFGRR